MIRGSYIGIFDSGVGGLSVAREVRRLLPAEDILYFADTAYCPYGGRPLTEIRGRSLAIGRYLVEAGAKILVVACNSASGAALEAIRADAAVPVVGIEPAVKPAAATTRNRKIGVMATAATLQAERFDRLMRDFARDVEVVSQACPGLVEFVEAGRTAPEEVRTALEEILEPLRTAGVDTVVLGCTHYPFLREAIADILGDDVVLIDTGPAVARQTAKILDEAHSLANRGSGSLRVWTTGRADEVAATVERLWGEPVPVEQIEV